MGRIYKWDVSLKAQMHGRVISYLSSVVQGDVFPIYINLNQYFWSPLFWFTDWVERQR